MTAGSLDPHSEAFVENRDAVLAGLRAHEPLAHSDAHGGFWLATRYADVRRVLLDPVTFSSAFPGRIAVPPTSTAGPPQPLLEYDPPRHDAQISLLAGWFGAAAVTPLQDAVAADAQALLAKARRAGRLEVVRELAQPLTSAAVTRHLRLPPDDADRWVGWAERIFATRVAEPRLAEEAAGQLRGYIAGLLEQRRREPRDDPWTLLATSAVQGQPLSEDEAVGYGTVLLLAGRDATVDGVTTAVVHLAQHPGDQAALREDPTRIPRAVEELLRVYTPIGHLARVATHDVQLGDKAIGEGETVAVMYGSANRDEAVFPDADMVVLDRRSNRHLAFGAGVHRCLGAQLARLVLATALREVLAALPPFVLDGSEPLVAKPNGDTRGFVAAHLRWER